MSKIVAIHQPNFFPWLGYFDKILRADAFIFLDHVQFPKTGGIWSNRVKLKIAGEAKWVTAPIMRNYSGVKAVNEIMFPDNDPWRGKMLKTITANYAKAPFYKEAFAFFEPLILNPDNRLSSYNAHAILAMAQQLGQSDGKFFWSSKLPYQGAANEMLISLTKALGGDVYLSGDGADGYQEESYYQNSGVRLQLQNFKHPQYAQGGGDFVVGLSLLDAVMHLGWTGTRDLLQAAKGSV